MYTPEEKVKGERERGCTVVVYVVGGSVWRVSSVIEGEAKLSISEQYHPLSVSLTLRDTYCLTSALLRYNHLHC